MIICFISWKEQVVCRRARVLFMLFLFAYVEWCQSRLDYKNMTGVL